MKSTEENNKKIRRRRGIILLLSLILVALVVILTPKENATPDTNQPKDIAHKEHKEISTDYSLNRFTEGTERGLLQEIGICDTMNVVENNLDVPACSPRFFRFFTLKNSTPLKSGFMLLIRSGVNAFPTRRLVVFERQNKKLIKVNGFIGYIIERRKTNSAYDDIVIRFFERYDRQKYFYHCLFTWKNNKYQYVNCEEINDQKIKVQLQDSVSNVVKQILIDKQYLF